MIKVLGFIYHMVAFVGCMVLAYLVTSWALFKVLPYVLKALY